MIRNTRQQWGSAAKTLHWLMVLMILAEVPAGYLMSYTYGLSFRDRQQGLPLHTLASQIHHTIGFAILLLVMTRLLWRICGVTPAPPRGGAAQTLASRGVHVTLYALLLLVPLSGWAALSVYGEAPVWLFDRSDLVPAILPRVPLKDPHGYGFYAKLHIRLLQIGIAVLTVHVAAALWHHFSRRDDVLLRMWPLAKPRLDRTAP